MRFPHLRPLLVIKDRGVALQAVSRIYGTSRHRRTPPSHRPRSLHRQNQLRHPVNDQPHGLQTLRNIKLSTPHTHVSFSALSTQHFSRHPELCEGSNPNFFISPISPIGYNKPDSLVFPPKLNPRSLFVQTSFPGE